MATAKKQAKQAAPAPQPSPVPANEQVVESGGALMVVGDKAQMPDYLKQAKHQPRGSEQVGMEDLVIPRLEVIQGLSPAVQPGNPGYVDGARQGDLLNSVTNVVYPGREVFVVPVFYTKQWLVWKKKSEGGGFYGAYPTPAEAKERADKEGGEKSHIEVVDTPTHLCLLVNRETGGVEEIMIPLPRTKAKVSRTWNSMIKLTGQDRFARVYRITTALEKNNKGQEYWNFVVAGSGFPTKPLFDRAEKLYNSITEGKRNVVMDVKGMGTGAEPEGDDPNPNAEM